MMRLAAGLLLVLVAFGSGAGAQEKLGIWVPLYAPPSPEYEALIKSVETDKCLQDSFHGTVLTGPRSGPPNPADKAEDELFRKSFDVVAKAQQWTAFGYIYTSYMARPLDAVLADIDTWLSPGAEGYGDQVQGIWIDSSVSRFNTTARKYYGTIIDKVKSYGKLVALNPGAQVGPWACGKVDFVNNFESPYDVWSDESRDRDFDCPCTDGTTRCIASIHTFPSDATSEDLAQTMRTLSARGYKAGFITEREMPNTYSALPAFWREEIDAACQTPADLNAAGGGAAPAADTSGDSMATGGDGLIVGETVAAPSPSPSPKAEPEPSPSPAPLVVSRAGGRRLKRLLL